MISAVNIEGMRRSTLRALCSLLVLLYSVVCSGKSYKSIDHFVYISIQSGSSERRESDYYFKILSEALNASKIQYGEYKLRSVICNDRNCLKKGIIKGVADAVTLVSVSQIENSLFAVKIPLDKGMMGYKILLIKAKNQSVFSSIKSIAELRKIRFGVQEDSADASLLKDFGFPISTGEDRNSLTNLMLSGGVDALIGNFWDGLYGLEDFQKNDPNVVIERDILLRSPMPVYFWFLKNETGIRYADRVHFGLEIILANGIFDKIFTSEIVKPISLLNLKNRRKILIPNLSLSDNQPFSVGGYWFNPLK